MASGLRAEAHRGSADSPDAGETEAAGPHVGRAPRGLGARGVASIGSSIGPSTRRLAVHSRVTAWNRSSNFSVIGPGTPAPILRLSTFVTGTISAALPVRKHSSAM